MDESESERKAAAKGKSGKKIIAGTTMGSISRLLPSSIVTPVLHDVGKLVACVAAVNTNCSSSNLSVTTGSATGNPRNKCALEPGHSLMDWIRLGYSGKDLTGVGTLAGKMTVSSDELQKHNLRQDAWISIRGNVYNVTDYLAFHPGGPEELMRGVGLPDATSLFDKVHPWVNYDKMLTKCFIGRLGTPNVSLKFNGGNLEVADTSDRTPLESNRETNKVQHIRHEWIQKLEEFILCFYTGQYSNPFLELHRPDEYDNTWTIVISTSECRHCFKFAPHDTLHWPPRYKILQESGKLILTFKKQSAALWDIYGTIDEIKSDLQLERKLEFVIDELEMLNEHTFMLSVRNADTVLSNTPIGHHLLLYNDANASREFTPIPQSYSQSKREQDTSQITTFIIRRYPEGCLSNYLYNKRAGDIIHTSEPIGSFKLNIIANHEHFLFIAGGVGVAPMLAILQFLLERKAKPVRSITLILFNPTREHQFLEDRFNSMAGDQRFHFISIVTRPPADYKGLTGYISTQLIQSALGNDVPIADVFYFICGPPALHNASFQNLQELQVRPSNSFFFASA